MKTVEMRAVTAGAFVRFGDRYVFGIGPSPEGDRIVILLAEPLDAELPLAPFLQFRLMARILAERPELLEGLQ